jgi:oligopeptide transport system substrate-binding protein
MRRRQNSGLMNRFASALCGKWGARFYFRDRRRNERPVEIAPRPKAEGRRPKQGRNPKAELRCPQRGNVVFASFVALLLCACVMIAGCRAQPRVNLVIINGGEPESLDPAIVTLAADMRITKALFEGLLRLDGRTGRPVPGWAESWDISPDGKVYTFHLRTNAVWSTGEPLTSANVLYSWRRALDPATASDYAGQLFYIKGAEDFYNGKIKDPAQVGIAALDATTFRVELSYPLAFFLDLCCFPTLAIVPRQTIDARGDRWLAARPLPSSGPYELVAWRLNDKVRLRKNPRYWDAANTRSEVIDLLPTASPNTALNLFETGMADVIWDKDLAPLELMDVVKNRPEFHPFPFLGAYFYRFNVTRKPFDDPRVRKAFALATDKGRLTRKLTFGGEKPASHFVPDGVANYQSPPGLGFDTDRARALLAEAGFPKGKGFPRFQYMYFSSAGGARLQERIGVELQQMWREVLGVEMELRQIERKIFYNAQTRLDYDMAASSWVGDYNDANTFLDLFTSNSGNNRTGWKNSRYDALLQAANRLVDIGQRSQLLNQAEELLVAEEAPIVPLYFYAGFTYYDATKIHGIYPNVLDEHPLQEIFKDEHRTSNAQRPTSKASFP